VVVGAETIARIERGLVVLVGIERDDTRPIADRLLERILSFRVFSDEQGKLNLSLVNVGGALLLIPQFTLAADTRKGTRASFTPAAPPESGRELFGYLVAQAEAQHGIVACGRFGAEMQVHLVNDGPVTFWLKTN
jgi:D-aminoacyl-tRNA deacylase